MAQHDYILDNQSGANFRADLNNALLAISSNNSGATQPSTMYAYEWWIDTSNNLLKLRNSGNSDWITLPISITADNTVDINGGTVNGISSFSLSSGSTITTILDEDDFSSNSATALATQQSIKAYVDSQVTAQDLDISDGSSTIAIDLDSETLSLLGGTGVTAAASGNGVTFSIGQDVAASSNVVFNQVTSALVGNASTATALQNARTINGTSFDGTSNISFDTDSVSEGSSNLYFTNARARAAISESSTQLSYNSSTGVLTYTQGDTDTVSEGSSNLYHTTARVQAISINNVVEDTTPQLGGSLDVNGQDIVSVSDGNITLTPNGTGVVRIDGSTGVDIQQGAISIKNGGTQSYIDFYCESANAHYARLQAPAHASFAGNITLTLPATTGTIALTSSSITGNAATATALQNARTISGVSFDGTSNITLDTDDIGEGSSNLYYTDARSNAAIDARVTNTFINNLSGVVADTATALATGRTIALTGDVTATGVSFDGTGNISLSTTIAANSVALGNDTTGNYVSTIAGTANEIEVSGSGSETASVTVGLPDDVTIAGNLTVNGTTTTVNSDTLNVTDPLIKLAKANSGADSLDIGFYGLYDTSGSQDLFAGLFRDANDSGKFKLFKDLQVEPTTTVNTSGTGYAVGTLVANLEGNVTGNVTGNVSGSSGSTTGNAATATTLETARAIALSGDVVGTANFDGSAGISITTAIQANSVALGTDTTGNYISTITGTSNEIEVSGSGSETASVTIGLPNDVTISNDLTVSGDLTVTGTTTQTGSVVTDSNFQGFTDGNTGNVTDFGFYGKYVESSTTKYAGLFYDASTDNTFRLFVDTQTKPSTTVNTGATGYAVASLVANLVGNASTASTLETARTINGVSFNGSANISFDTDSVSEGSSNLYYTNERVSDQVGSMVTSNTETGITVTYDDADNTLDFAINAAQTSITSILATDLKIGEDDETKIDFETADEIHFYAGNQHQIKLTDGALIPVTTNDIDLGTSSLEFKDAFFDGVVTSDSFVGELTGNSSTATKLATTRAIGLGGDLSGSANFDGSAAITITATIQADAVEQSMIADDAVGADQLAASAVVTASIVDDAITQAKIADNSVDIARLDVTDGSNGQVLTTDGAGNLSFAAASGGASSINDLSDAKTFGTSSILLGDATTGTIDGANYNTGVGVDVFAALTSGDRNTGIGFASMDATTTGSDNTAVGNASLGANTTASCNVAVGSSALTTNTEGANNVGIGCDALQANTTASHNTAVGTSALAANTTGVENVAVGKSALAANTTASNNVAVGVECLDANTTGTQNTAMGKASMSANTTGNYNAAFGAYSLQANTTAEENTAIGYEALNDNTTGNKNTAVGFRALDLNTTASENTAIGGDALGNTTTGGNNTAVGRLALQKNTTGVSNTAVGHQALDASTTANNNSAFGKDALGACTTGGHNTALGLDALRLNTTGGDNTAVGSGALYNITTSSRNTAVGRSCLDDCDGVTDNTAMGWNAAGGITTGNENVIIGSQTGDSISTGSANTIVGFRAATGATTSYQNTIIGSDCAYSLTTGFKNLCLDQNAGYNLTTGDRNICIGQNARPSAGTDYRSIIMSTYEGSGKGNNTFFITAGTGSGNGYQGNNSSSWATTSDKRIKKNIVENNDGLNKIEQIQVKNFEYRTKQEITDWSGDDVNAVTVEKEGLQLGVIAQEIKEVLPDVVNERENGCLSVDADNITWYLVNAVKELSAEVKELKQKLGE